MDVNSAFVFMRYYSTWRRQRHLFAQHLNPTASRAFFERQTLSAKNLPRSILAVPGDLAAHLKHCAAETTLAIAYGYNIKPRNDPMAAFAENAISILSQGALPGRFFVNVFPWLNYIPAWFPGTGFKNFAEKGREAQRHFIETPFEDARRRTVEGTALPSFVTGALANPDAEQIQDDVKAVASTMYGAAVDTTDANMHSCILAFILYPAIQVRAQEEPDAVLGPPTSQTFRLPSFADRDRLPYIDAIVKESLRWIPALPISLPHAATNDDVYRGRRIPKNAIIIENAWSLLQDEETYPDPQVFRPERYLGDKPAPHPGLRGCFGFGRRECPGRHLAEASMWIQIASLLAAYTFSPPTDKDGRKTDISYARHPRPGLVLRPQHFPCTITPRCKEAEMRVRESRPKTE